MPAPPVVIQAGGLSKRYGRRPAVEHLTFAVAAGQICALLGPNGAGKTSTMRMLVGLAEPDTGTVRISDQPVRLGVPVLRRVSVLIDGPAFVPHLTGMANLRLLWAASRRAWPPRGLDDALDLAGLGDAIDRKVKVYSMGMKQRLMPRSSCWPVTSSCSTTAGWSPTARSTPCWGRISRWRTPTSR
jgi:ABC-type multidrug transport system ATPase subunit